MKIKCVSPTRPLHPSCVTECTVCHCVWRDRFFHPINLSIVKQVKGFSNNTVMFWRELMSNWIPALEDLVLWISPTFQFYFSWKFRYFFFSLRFSFFQVLKEFCKGNSSGALHLFLKAFVLFWLLFWRDGGQLHLVVHCNWIYWQRCRGSAQALKRGR